MPDDKQNAVADLARLTEGMDIRGMICLLLTDHLFDAPAVSRDETAVLADVLSTLRQVVQAERLGLSHAAAKMIASQILDNFESRVMALRCGEDHLG